MKTKSILATTMSAAVALLALTACVPNNAAGGGDKAGAITVDSAKDACNVSTASAKSGNLRFSVTNSGDQVTEFYLLADDGLRIIGEIENIGPGLSRDLVVQAQPGKYFTVCKPGMVGDGIGKASFTVSGDKVQLAGSQQDQVDSAAKNYVAYVKDQVAQLVTGTNTFLDAYLAGDDDKARSLYATTRANYERIEPVAESFGDLDPEIDFREADVAAGDEWTGWHRIEKDLWPPAPAENAGVSYVALTTDERKDFADKLKTNTQQLSDAVNASDYTVTMDAISNGAIGLLEEVASGKITGEEEIWSHTDLWDFQANLEGARVAYEGVRDIVESKDPDLIKKIDTQFADLEKQLAQYGSLADGFTYYNDLTPAQIKDLADGVNALSEPLSQLTASLVG